MITYRILHPLGYVEFTDLAAAEAYRDDWFPGAVVVTVSPAPGSYTEGTRGGTEATETTRPPAVLPHPPSGSVPSV